MAQFINPKSNANIDGIVEEFVLQSESINAGEFVNFIDKMNIDYSSSALDTSQAYTGNNLKSLKLSENVVIVLHRTGSTTTLTATLFKISGNTITKGISAVVGEGQSDCLTYEAAMLDDSHFVIAMCRTANANTLYAKVVEVTETAIKPSTAIQISSESSSGTFLSVSRLTDQRFMITHTNSSYVVKACLCETDGSEITIKSRITATATTNSATYHESIALDESRVLILHLAGSTLNGTVITVDGDSLTVNDTYSLVEGQYGTQKLSLAMVDENKVVIAFSYLSSNQLYGVVCGVDGSVVTHGDLVKLYDTNNSGLNIIQELEKNKIVIFHKSDSSIAHLRCIVCSVVDLVLLKNIDVAIDTNNQTASSMCSEMIENQIALFHSETGSYSYLTGKLLSEEMYAHKMTTKDEPYGIAMKNANQGVKVKVAMPKV